MEFGFIAKEVSQTIPRRLHYIIINLPEMRLYDAVVLWLDWGMWVGSISPLNSLYWILVTDPTHHNALSNHLFKLK